MGEHQVVAIIAAIVQLADRLDPDLDKDGCRISYTSDEEAVERARALLFAAEPRRD